MARPAPISSNEDGFAARENDGGDALGGGVRNEQMTQVDQSFDAAVEKDVPAADAIAPPNLDSAHAHGLRGFHGHPSIRKPPLHRTPWPR